VIERSLLAALIAGLIIPPAASAQATPWRCQADPRGGWQCTPAEAAAADTTPNAATREAPRASPSAPVPAPDPTITAPAAATPTPPAPAPESPAAQTAAPPGDARVPAPAPAAAITPRPAGVTTNAAEDPYGPWALCAPRGAAMLPDDSLQGTDFDADDAEIQQNRIYVLTGDVVMQRAGQRVQADRVRYDQTLDRVDAEGNLRIDQAAMRVTGTQATLQLDSDQGEIRDAEYEIYAQHARGQASAAYQESPVRKRFEDATYTTCDADAEAWRLNARSVVLQQDEGVGTARHAWLQLGAVPVLYTPYISFPIDDRRKSGLLVPSWGNSDNSGAEFALPYYWNIAPHRDATITPRLLSDRGVQMQGEFRYLNPSNSGILGLEYLPSDNEYANEDRSLFRIEHDGRPLPRLRTTLFGTDVSDDDYFEDLGNSLDISSITHLERRAQARYNGNGWTLTGRAQDYQTVDSTASEPYRRLPQLLLTANPYTRPYGLELNLDSEAVRFDHEDFVDGTRLDLYPKVSLPLGGAAWYVTPATGVRYTAYDLNEPASGTDDPDRTTPVVSLDSGLFFERNASLFGNGLLQTLEPRAFYLYVPNEDQADLPRFDTSLRDFSFQQMFEDNRFSGADRMGDANQLTLAVTSRLLDPATGTQHASVSLGQILYFRDREVTLSGTAPEEQQSSSNLVGEVDLRLTQSWKTIAGLQWDPHLSRTERSNVRLQYRPNPQHLWNFTYRYRAGIQEQVDTSALWYFTPRWHGVMRWNYSLPDRELLEGLAGLEYESCCWIFRLLGRSYISDIEGERNDAIMFQLELKGLTSFGDPVESLLEDGILGYPQQ
jgi:LPS-assembly protein